MKNILIIFTIIIICFWGVSSCHSWQVINELKALEDCQKIHSEEQCKAWSARGY